MSSEDERIVSMKFNNTQFEQGVKTSLDSLAALNKGLQLQGATKGLSDISAASSKFSLKSIADGVDSISQKFSAMSIIGITALTNIANKAVNAGMQLAKSLTVAPITAGLHEYETQLNSIQTIMANTGLEGQKGLNQVNAALQELNTYSDKTIYNFTEMARNIGTFTAAGVGLKPATAAIKGIANLAAVSGSSAEQASTAMYQLSQAMASGTVKLMDWNSVVNAGMGGKVFQESLKETARVHGVAIDKMVKDEGSFRETLKNGWLTSDILTETLSKFTGDLTAQQLKTMGYNEQQIAGILKMGKTATDAATKVKTMSQLISTLQEAAGSGWAQTWQLLFGDFEEARTMFTNVSNVIGGFITASAQARNKVLGDWKKLGGRTVLIDAISKAFSALIAVIKPIRDAFREIFPATTAKQLFAMTVAIRDFAAKLKIGADVANKLRRTFAGVFAILGIGWEIVKQVAKTLAGLFGELSGGAGSILGVTANLGDFLVRLHEVVKNGSKLTTFFQKLGTVLAFPVKALKFLADVIGDLFRGVTDMQGIPDVIAKRFEPMTRIGQILTKIWQNALGIFRRLQKAFQPVADFFIKAFGSLMTTIEDALAKTDYSQVLDTINTGLFAALTLAIRKFLKGGLFKGVDVSGGMFDSVKKVFGGLTDTLSAMQANLKSGTLLKIAGAVALLTASVVALSLIDSAKLTKALVAIAIMFTQLYGSMVIFEKISASKGFLKMPFVATSLILLSVAIDLLAIAVSKLAKLDWTGLAKGLTGVTVLMGALVLASKGLAGNAGGMISAGAGLILLAGAIKLLVSSVKDFSEMNWGSMVKGLTGVGLLLGALALFTKFSAANKGGLAQGAGIVLLAVGIKILASALNDLGSMSWSKMAKGLVGMAGGLVLMAAALAILPPSSVLSAAAIFIAATSITILGAALKKMGSMSWGEIAKSLVMLAGSLTILAVAMYAMTGALPGAAATLIVAGALRILLPVLLAFGDMSWGEIVKGLAMLAGVFVVLGAAGLILGPIAPIILVLGAAVALLGVGMLAAGAGVLAFSMALTALSVAGGAATATLIAIVSGLVGLIPMVMTELATGLIAFAQVIATAGPAFTAAMAAVITAIANAVITTAPKIYQAMMTMVDLLLKTLANAIPKMIATGMAILIAFLKGIRDNIYQIVTIGADIIVRLIQGISDNNKKLLTAGADMIIKFIKDLAATIRTKAPELGEAAGDLGGAIISGMITGLWSGLTRLLSSVSEIGSRVISAAKHIFDSHSPSRVFMAIGNDNMEGLTLGMQAMSGKVSNAAENVGKDAILAMSKSISGLSDMVSGEVKMNPTITPIIDLSQVRKDAPKIGALIGSATVTPKASLGQATSISNERQAAQAAQAAATTVKAETPATVVQFEQNNYSPKALSPAEIYRQTRNQLSLAKEALNAT